MFKKANRFLFLTGLFILKAVMLVGQDRGTAEDVFTRMDSLEALSMREEAMVLLDEFIEQQTTSVSPDIKGLVKAYIRKGMNLRTTGQNNESTDLLQKALLEARSINDAALISYASRELGFNHVIAGRYDEGLEAYSRALEIDTGFEDWVNVSLALNAIGKIHEMWRDFDKALEFFYRSLEIAQENNYRHQMAVRKASIASVYKSQGKFDLALDWLERSLNLEIELENEVRKGYRLDQIGEIYTLMGQYGRAEDYLLQALEIFREHNILVSESIVLNHIGLNYLKMEEFDKAMTHYTQSLEIAQRVGFNNMIQKNYEEISLLHEKTGNFMLALENYKKLVEIRDSTYNERARKQLLDFQVRYETEQKEKELALLNQEKLVQELALNRSQQRILIMVGVSALLLILLGTLYSRFHLKKRAQEKLAIINHQLTELNNTKDKFFNILAHDLKNPISAFRNISTAVHDNYSTLSNEEVSYYTGELKDSSVKLCAFLDRLLQWAASQTGRITPKKEVIDLKPMFDELIELHLAMGNNKNLQIELHVNENHRAMADYNMIHTVFRNLLSNAIKFTPEKGWVRIESQENGSNVSVSISDSGIGIAEQDLEKLFSITSDPTKIGNHQEKGMGVGLILCKEFVDKNQGKIHVNSRLDEGTTFKVVLPAR